MKRRSFVVMAVTSVASAGLALAGCSVTAGSGRDTGTDVSKRQQIDASVDDTLSRLYATVGGFRDLVLRAQGVLVFPSVAKAGIYIGGAYGEGALRLGGVTAGYYSAAAASFALQGAAQSTSVIFLFMTQDALDNFLNSAGWSVGGNHAVSLVKVGANGSIDMGTATAPVSVIVMTNTGVMADVPLAGTRVTKLSL
jgi:lipid-binding SYLF domain-containing protein